MRRWDIIHFIINGHNMKITQHVSVMITILAMAVIIYRTSAVYSTQDCYLITGDN